MSAEGKLFVVSPREGRPAAIRVRGEIALGQLPTMLQDVWMDHLQSYDMQAAITEELAASGGIINLFRKGGAVTLSGEQATRPFQEIIANMPGEWQEELNVRGYLQRRLYECSWNDVRLGIANADGAESVFIFDPSFIYKIGYRATSGGAYRFDHAPEYEEQIIAYERARRGDIRRSWDYAAVPQIEILVGNMVGHYREAHPLTHPYPHLSSRSLGRATLFEMTSELPPRK